MDPERDERTLFFKNLTYSLTEDVLEDSIKSEFKAAMEAGTVDHEIEIDADQERQRAVFILKDKNQMNHNGQPRSKGMAFVTLKDKADVEKAIEILSGKSFEGREIFVERKRTFDSSDRAPMPMAA